MSLVYCNQAICTAFSGRISWNSRPALINIASPDHKIPKMLAFPFPRIVVKNKRKYRLMARSERLPEQSHKVMLNFDDIFCNFNNWRQ
jgi:hypothetical protein